MQQPLRVDVRRDWAWSDQFLPDVKRVLGQCAIHLVEVQIATPEQDLTQATDMIATIKGYKTVAVRLRRASYHQRDLTIRTWRASGAQTELDKIKHGYGHLYLYGWTLEYQISEWMLVDLERLRNSGLLDRRSLITNRNGDTRFLTIPAYELWREGCILTQQGMLL